MQRLLTLTLVGVALTLADYQATLMTDLDEMPPIVINVTERWAPLGAARFRELLRASFFDDSAFFRYVPDFVVQFGINGTPAANKVWGNRMIKDDPVLASNTFGTVTYATAGPNTRTTQLFINFGNNSRLDSMGFAPFGTVVSGMETALEVFNPTPGSSGGVDQEDYSEKGNRWVRKAYPHINFITKGAEGLLSPSELGNSDADEEAFLQVLLLLGLVGIIAGVGCLCFLGGRAGVLGRRDGGKPIRLEMLDDGSEVGV